jgi:CMP-N-acetylneuraminic acid synthetase
VPQIPAVVIIKPKAERILIPMLSLYNCYITNSSIYIFTRARSCNAYQLRSGNMTYFQFRRISIIDVTLLAMDRRKS